MKSKRDQSVAEDYLALVFKKTKGLGYRLSNDYDAPIVTVLEPQAHWIQKGARKIGFKIPHYKKVALDKYGSFVFLAVDGNHTVKQIGTMLSEQFGEAAAPVYPRLQLFLDHLYQTAHYIEL